MAKKKALSSLASRKREMTGTNNEARKRDIAVLHLRLDDVLREFRMLSARVDNMARVLTGLGR